MQIKDVEQKTGLTRKAIRYYEECGLICVDKAENGYKNYHNNHVDELLRIKQLRLLEFSVPEINDYLRGKERNVILERKINESEEQINVMQERIRLVKLLLNGEGPESIEFENELEKRKGEQLKSIKINFGFGIVNLVALIFVCLVFFKLDVSFSLNYVVFIQIIIFLASLRWDNKRYLKAKKEGQLVIRRTWMEMAFKLIVNIATYSLGACMIKEVLGYVGRFGLFNTIANIWIAVMFSVGIIAVMVISFTCSTKESMEFMR